MNPNEVIEVIDIFEVLDDDAKEELSNGKGDEEDDEDE